MIIMHIDCFLNEALNHSASDGFFPALTTNNILNVDIFHANAKIMGGIREDPQTYGL